MRRQLDADEAVSIGLFVEPKWTYRAVIETVAEAE
jgi:hypothetical protein